MHESDQTRLFRVLKSTIRRQMIDELRDRDLSPGFFALVYDLSPSAVTKHLKIMERTGLITRYQEGRKRMCRLDKRQLQAMKVDWLIKLLL